MKGYSIDEILFKKLDCWLGTRRLATRKFLNPLNFSIDTGIDAEVAMYIFALCTQTNINILKVKYVVECRNCNHICGKYYSTGDIPRKISCSDCGISIDVNEDDIKIWFELIQEPEAHPFPTTMKNVIEGVYDLGKQIASVHLI
jgi:hypothetical protein